MSGVVIVRRMTSRTCHLLLLSATVVLAVVLLIATLRIGSLEALPLDPVAPTRCVLATFNPLHALGPESLMNTAAGSSTATVASSISSSSTT